MKTKNKMRKLSVILDDYNNVLNDYKQSQSEEIKERINSLQNEAKKNIELRKKDDREFAIFGLLLCILLIFTGIFILLLSKNNNNLLNDNIKKANIINRLQQTDSLFSEIINTKYDTLGKEMITFLRNDKGKMVNYDELSNKNTHLTEKNTDLIKEITFLKIKLDLVQKNYDIKFIETDKYISINADKIDSALLLLPYYRDKLRYDQENKSWIITFPKK